MIIDDGILLRGFSIELLAIEFVFKICRTILSKIIVHGAPESFSGCAPWIPIRLFLFVAYQCIDNIIVVNGLQN